MQIQKWVLVGVASKNGFEEGTVGAEYNLVSLDLFIITCKSYIKKVPLLSHCFECTINITFNVIPTKGKLDIGNHVCGDSILNSEIKVNYYASFDKRGTSQLLKVYQVGGNESEQVL